jgi:hypothetical protein
VISYCVFLLVWFYLKNLYELLTIYQALCLLLGNMPLFFCSCQKQVSAEHGGCMSVIPVAVGSCKNPGKNTQAKHPPWQNTQTKNSHESKYTKTQSISDVNFFNLICECNQFLLEEMRLAFF